MTFDELKAKAASLPLAPGVYIMRDADNEVIYVGKAKKLRNRVSQYFQDTISHTPKTKTMVSKVRNFDVIVASSEFEALVLECAQIKRYAPRYNILLKDDKGFPYLRLDSKSAYARLSLVNKTEDDGAEYFGPYGSRGVSQRLIDTLLQTLQLPSCNRKFPRDIGKGRHCLNYHMGRCQGWCQLPDPQRMYAERIQQLRMLLNGNYRGVIEPLKQEMNTAAEDLNFELAATIRDRLKAIEVLKQQQFVTAQTNCDIDAIGFAQTEMIACFAVLHFSGGELVDKDYALISPEDGQLAVSSLIKQYYLNRGYAPAQILLPFNIDDGDLFQQLLQQTYSSRTVIKVPQRGDNVRLVELAVKNALEEAERITDKDGRRRATLQHLCQMLSVAKLHRIESFDISNISGSDNVAAMVVFTDGKPNKSQYRHFKIPLDGQPNDYESMRQVLSRRIDKYIDQDKGFEELPDIWLIDGGFTHAEVAVSVLSEKGISLPVMGMVKDDRHRTRALISADNREIRIDNHPAIFSLIGQIQEETHRFAISYHRKLRSKRLKASELDNIPGIGPKRKQDLLKHFSSVAAIRNASIVELEHYLPHNVATAVYTYFHQQKG